MIKNEYFIKRQDGKKSAPLALSVLRTAPDTPAEAKFVVQIIHGMFDCKERYLPFMTAVAEAGGIAVIHDMRGFGNTVRSADELGDLGDFGYDYETLIGDINTVYASVGTVPEDGEMIECRYYPEVDTPEIPRYIVGFSYGAMVTAMLIARDTSTAAGAVLAGLPHHERTVGAKIFSQSIKSLFTGDLSKPKSLYRRMTERYSKKYADPAMYDQKLAWYMTDFISRGELTGDSICVHRKTTGAYLSYLKMLRDTYRPSTYNKPRKNFPLLITAGEYDPEAGGDKQVLYSDKFFRDMGFETEVMMYRGMRHDLFHDIGCENAVSDILAFFARHLEKENERLDAIKAEYTAQFDTEEIK